MPQTYCQFLGCGIRNKKAVLRISEERLYI